MLSVMKVYIEDFIMWLILMFELHFLTRHKCYSNEKYYDDFTSLVRPEL